RRPQRAMANCADVNPGITKLRRITSRYGAPYCRDSDSSPSKVSTRRRRALGSGFEDDLDTRVLLIVEHLIGRRSILQRQAMGYDKRGIHLSGENLCQECAGIFLHVGLTHSQG